MKTINTPHDVLVKLSLKDIAIARDFLKAHLPQHVLQYIDLQTLAPTDGEFVLPRLKKIQSDIVYQCQIHGEAGYLYLLIEHQSTHDSLMPFRMLQYQMALMDAHLKKGHKKLPIIIPLCLYHGKQSPYPDGQSILQCFEDETLAAQLAMKDFHLVDVTVMTDEEITQHGLAGLFEMLVKHHNTKQVYRLVNYLNQVGLLRRVINKLNDSGNYLSAMVEYLLNTGEDREHDIREILGLLSKTLPGSLLTVY